MALICYLVRLKKNTPNQKQTTTETKQQTKKGLKTVFVASLDLGLCENVKKKKNQEHIFSN